MDEGFESSSFSEVDEDVSRNRAHFEDKLLVTRSPKVKDYKEHSMTIEERDEIVRKYNAEHFHLRESSDVVDDSEQSDMSLTDSDDLTDEYEGMEPMEKMAHLLGELAKVGDIAVKQNMRFLDQEKLDELLAVGQNFLGSCKSSIVSVKSNDSLERSAISETEDVEQ